MTIDKSKPLDQQIADHLQYQIDININQIETLELLIDTASREVNNMHNTNQRNLLVSKNRQLQTLLNYQLNSIANK